MHLKLNRALCATTALATSLLLASSALAQSTATQVQELVVTGAHGQPNIAGAITQVQEAKDESIVTHEYFERQQAGQNFAQLINQLPGVNYSTEDAGGNLSGDLRIHGFDGNHISVTIDGSPVNDTGNYAIFPGRVPRSGTHRPHHRQSRRDLGGQSHGLGHRRHRGYRDENPDAHSAADHPAHGR